MSELLNAIIHNNFDEANRMIKGLRLTEDDFQAQHGGLFWLIVIAVCILLRRIN
jgi:hypothetical protein